MSYGLENTVTRGVAFGDLCWLAAVSPPLTNAVVISDLVEMLNEFEGDDADTSFGLALWALAQWDAGLTVDGVEFLRTWYGVEFPGDEWPINDPAAAVVCGNKLAGAFSPILLAIETGLGEGVYARVLPEIIADLRQGLRPEFIGSPFGAFLSAFIRALVDYGAARAASWVRSRCGVPSF